MLLEIAHHRLLEFVRAGTRGAGNAKDRAFPAQAPHDVLGAPLGFGRLQQIDFIDEQPALFGA